MVNNGNTYDGGYCFVQTADINLGGHEWYPIGGELYQFQGSYDGQNFDITGLILVDYNLTFSGLFGYVDCGEMKNINLINPYITSKKEHVAGIVGAANESVIINCHVKGGYISADSGKVAGIHGGAYGAKIIDCSNSADIYSSYYSVGGIAGWTNGDMARIENCINYGRVEGNSATIQVGGICGLMIGWGTIIDCVNNGNVKGRNSVGGIVGNAEAKIYSCMSNCIVEQTNTEYQGLGGILGTVYTQGTSEVKNCVANVTLISAVTSAEQTGLIIGCGDGDITTNPIVENCSFNGSSNVSGARFVGTFGLPASDVSNSYAIINQDKIYSNGDFSGFALEAGFNKGLPAQKALYWAMSVVPSIDVSWFSANGFRKV